MEGQGKEPCPSHSHQVLPEPPGKRHAAVPGECHAHPSYLCHPLLTVFPSKLQRVVCCYRLSAATALSTAEPLLYAPCTPSL